MAEDEPISETRRTAASYVDEVLARALLEGDASLVYADPADPARGFRIKLNPPRSLALKPPSEAVL